MAVRSELGSDTSTLLNLIQEDAVSIQHHRRLLVREEVKALLQLPDHKLQHLIDTRQVLALRLAGEERFDSLELDRLIEAYKATASRRTQ